MSLAQYDQKVRSGAFEDRRLELIHGELRDMMPIGPLHEVVVDRLNEWSIQHRPKDAVWVRVQNSIGLPELASAPEPDIVWVARRDYSQSRPTAADVLLVVEVAETSLAYDRGEKADLYASAGIEDYWVVNLKERSIQVFRDPGPDHYRTLRTYLGDEPISPLAYPEIRLVPAQLWEQQ